MLGLLNPHFSHTPIHIHYYYHVTKLRLRHRHKLLINYLCWCPAGKMYEILNTIGVKLLRILYASIFILHLIRRELSSFYLRYTSLWSG